MSGRYSLAIPILPLGNGDDEGAVRLACISAKKFLDEHPHDPVHLVLLTSRGKNASLSTMQQFLGDALVGEPDDGAVWRCSLRQSDPLLSVALLRPHVSVHMTDSLDTHRVTSRLVDSDIALKLI